MALFHRKEKDSSSIPYYTFGMHKSLLIVGLGNVGEAYQHTRHNLGFAAVDHFAQAHDFPDWKEKKELRCFITKQTFGDVQVVLMKPTTLMNNSGLAVQAVSRFYKLQPVSVVVVHDELDVPFGQIRMRVGGGSAGHNGVKSVIQHIGAEFGRVRIGIGGNRPQQMDHSDYVLGKLSKAELAEMGNLQRECTSILTEYVYRGELLSETRSFTV